MAAYPSVIDTFPGTAAQGTSLLTSPDHANDHRLLGSAVGSIEILLGTTGAGTSLFSHFTPNGSLVGTINLTSGTIINGQIDNSLITNAVFGSSTSGTIKNLVLGTNSIIGGTATSLVGTADSNNFSAKSVKSATTTIDLSAATAPSSGQVLTATSTTTATWQTPAPGKGFFFTTASGASFNGSQTLYTTPGDLVSPTATEAGHQMMVPAGTVNGLYLRLGTNTISSGTSTVNFRINGTSLGPSVSVPFGSTGNFIGTQLGTMAQGDLVDVQWALSGGTGAIGIQSLLITLST